MRPHHVHHTQYLHFKTLQNLLLRHAIMQFYFTYIIKNVHSRFKHGLAYVHCCAPNINPDFLILPASVAVWMKNEMAYAWEIHTTFYISNLLIIDKCILYLLPFVYICTLYKPFMYSFLFPIYKVLGKVWPGFKNKYDSWSEIVPNILFYQGIFS